MASVDCSLMIRFPAGCSHPSLVLLSLSLSLSPDCCWSFRFLSLNSHWHKSSCVVDLRQIESDRIIQSIVEEEESEVNNNNNHEQMNSLSLCLSFSVVSLSLSLPSLSTFKRPTGFSIWMFVFFVQW